jgi:hypothetical protein
MQELYNIYVKAKKMIKNLIITIGALIILGLALLIYSTSYQHKESKVVRFPEIKLGKNERIIGAEMIFQSTYIKSIRNIPTEWDVDLNVPPNPIFKGSIIVGAAALESSKELPEFEIDSYSKDSKALKAIYYVTKYPTDHPDEGKRIEIEINKP